MIVYALKRPFTDGTTHVLFEPNDFIARLGARVPRPRAPLTRHHGLFAPNARHRHLIVSSKSSEASHERSDNHPESPGAPPTSIRAPMTWRARLKPVFDIELSVCPRCGGKLRVLGEVTAPKVIARILEHLKSRERQEHAPRAPPARLAEPAQPTHPSAST